MNCKYKLLKTTEDIVGIEDNGDDKLLEDPEETVYDLRVKTIPSSSYVLLIQKESNTETALILFESKLYWVHEKCINGVTIL